MDVDVILYRKLVTEKLMTKTKEEVISVLLNHIDDCEIDDVVREIYKNEKTKE